MDPYRDMVYKGIYIYMCVFHIFRIKLICWPQGRGVSLTNAASQNKWPHLVRNKGNPIGTNHGV